jgi:hypothetical protein
MWCRSNSHSKRKGSRLKSQSAVALLETSLVLPMLLLMLFGLIYLSVRLQARALITNVTQEGARILSRDNSVSCEASFLSVWGTAPEVRPCPGNSVATNNAVSGTHMGIYKLLKAMNTIDPKFRVSQINLVTSYKGGVNNPFQEDNVFVSMDATVEAKTLVSNSILETAGLFTYSIHSISSQPFLLTVSP